MPIEHNTANRPTVPHGDALALLPVEDLGAPIVQDRDAQRVLDDVDEEDVLVVAPDGMASGYKLAQHPLTLVAVDGLGDERRAAFEAASGLSLDEFTHVQVGRTVRSGENRSLAEFRA